MTRITPAITREFIRSVKLPAPARRSRAMTDAALAPPPVELKQTEAQTLVVGSGLIVAAENVPAQTREDLVDCTLFAQLAATGTVGASSKVKDWYDAYFRALAILGWAQSDTQFEDYAFSGRKAEAHKAMIQVLTVLLGPQAAALVVLKAALDALQSMQENSPWITLFERQSRTGKSARFQTATAQIDPAGLLQTALVGFELKTTSTVTQFLFFKFSSSSTSLRYAAGKATIYEAALSDQREQIKKRLEDYRTSYIGEVPLAPNKGAARRTTRGFRRIRLPILTPSRTWKEIMR
jgi:hypothetical protein